MPLSDHERQLLAEMEAAFAQDDPRLASTLNGKVRTRQASRVLLGVLLLLGGMAILLGGLVAKITALGIAGFIISLVGAFFIISNFSLSAMAMPQKKSGAGFKDRLEGRWERRNFDN